MKIFQLALILLSLSLPLASWADTPDDPDSDPRPEAAVTSSAPIAVDKNKFYLPCEFDSLKTTCLLDTGSTFSTINSPEFDHYPSWGHIKYNGGTGKEIDVDKIYIHKLKLAELALKSWPVARLSHLAGSQNILGLDVFKRSPVLFDFKNHTLTINPSTPEKISGSPLILEYGLLLIPVKIGDQELYAVWDTGSSHCVVDKEYIVKHPDQFIYVKKIEGTDATHTDMSMGLYLMKELVIGQYRFKNVHVAAMDLSGMRKVHPNFPVFFLGYNLIANHSWYFDLANSQWGVK